MSDRSDADARLDVEAAGYKEGDSMATLQDAIDVLTDGQFRGIGGPERGLVPMLPGVLTRLRQFGGSQGEARLLVSRALRTLGGENRSRFEESRTAALGGAARHVWVDDFWVPAKKLRATPRSGVEQETGR